MCRAPADCAANLSRFLDPAVLADCVSEVRGGRRCVGEVESMAHGMTGRKMISGTPHRTVKSRSRGSRRHRCYGEYGKNGIENTRSCGPVRRILLD
jgi:hypothetical protein